MKSLTKTFALACLAAVLAASTAIAQDTRPGRYTMHKTEDGFVRLDTETGAISMCRKNGNGWSCSDLDERTDGPPNRNEPNDLAAENRELKAEIKRLEELLELRGNNRQDSEPKKSFKLPTEREVDQALDYFERMLKKFQDRLKRLEQGTEKPSRQL